MKVRVEGSHDIRTIEHVHSIIVTPDEGENAKQHLTVDVDSSTDGGGLVTIKEAIHE